MSDISGTVICVGMVYLKVVDEAVSSDEVVDVPTSEAVRVFADDVAVIVVVSTEPKNGNCRHQSSSSPSEFLLVVVDVIQLVTDDGW